MKAKKKKKVDDDVAFANTIDNTFKQIIGARFETKTINEESRLIAIDQLPDCDHKSKLIHIVKDASTSTICIIAFLNPDGKWDALAGYPDVRDLKNIYDLFPYPWVFDVLWHCENVRSKSEVLIAGDRLSRDEALILFPDWKIKEYGE